jgi:hypothetical protein
MRRFLCFILGHKYKLPLPYLIIPETRYYLFEDICERCGYKHRFWNTSKEMGEVD